MTKAILTNSGLSAALVGAALTRSITVEQINAARNGRGLERHTALRNIDEEARTVEVAFSSEEPVPRWFGDEVLDHTPGAMSEARLRDGAAVLWNHNMDVQVGVVESASIDGDRRGRAVLRFGRSARAQEIWSDIVDGVIRHVSVGYFVRAIKTEEREGERDRVTITEWEPYEISMVSVPADATVGVGRSAGEPPEEAGRAASNTGDQSTGDLGSEEEGTQAMERNVWHNGAFVRARVDEDGKVLEVLETLTGADAIRAQVADGTRLEQERTAALLELGENYSAQRLAAEAIRDGVSVDAFTRTLLDHVGNADRGDDTGSRTLSSDAGTTGMSDTDARRFSFLRAVNAMMNPGDRSAQEAAAFEYEASRAAEQSMGRTAQGIMVPVEVLTRALNTSTAGTNPGDTGGYFVDTTLATQSFIQLLRNRSVFLQMATPMGGLVGNLDIPGQANGGNVFWVGEDEDVGEGAYDGRLVSMSPKTIGVFGDVTRRMAMQSSMDVEARFRASLARDLALGIDHAGFYGAGTANVPLGVFNHAGINSVTFSALQPSYLELVQMESEVSSDNADTDSMAYVGNSKFRGHCKSTEKFTGSNGAPIWEPGNTVNGTRAEITNQIALGDVCYGNFADANVGMWGALDILVDPYTKGKSGTRRVIMHQDVDISVNNVESFCIGRDAV